MIGLVVVDSLVWAGWSAMVGFVISRAPQRAFERDTVVTRLRAFERQGRIYEPLRIRRWKDHLPEAGALFGGVSKRALPSGARSGLVRFAAETRRAEIVHWAILVLAPVFLVWNPVPLALAMAGYAVAANVPCLIVQRYNRARIARVLDRRHRQVPLAPGDPKGAPR
jgi:glycosyl-4,4'-diaponeurosporenoate acyltransferase